MCLTWNQGARNHNPCRRVHVCAIVGGGCNITTTTNSVATTIPTTTLASVSPTTSPSQPMTILPSTYIILSHQVPMYGYIAACCPSCSQPSSFSNAIFAWPTLVGINTCPTYTPQLGLPTPTAIDPEESPCSKPDNVHDVGEWVRYGGVLLTSYEVNSY